MAEEKRKQGRQPTHGVHKMRRVAIKGWPLATRRAHQRRVDELAALPHIDMRRHSSAVHQVNGLAVR